MGQQSSGFKNSASSMRAGPIEFFGHRPSAQGVWGYHPPCHTPEMMLAEVPNPLISVPVNMLTTHPVLPLECHLARDAIGDRGEADRDTVPTLCHIMLHQTDAGVARGRTRRRLTPRNQAELTYFPVSTWWPGFYMAGSWNPWHCMCRYTALEEFSEEREY